MSDVAITIWTSFGLAAAGALMSFILAVPKIRDGFLKQSLSLMLFKV